MNDKVYGYDVHKNGFRALYYRCDLFAFFSGEQRQVESKMGPLGVCLSLYAYFELAFAHLKNKKAPLLQATVIVSRTL